MTRTGELHKELQEKERAMTLEVAALNLKRTREIEEARARYLQSAIDERLAFLCSKCGKYVWKIWYDKDLELKALRDGDLCFSCHSDREVQKKCVGSREKLLGAVVEEARFWDVGKPNEITLLLKDGSRAKYNIEYLGDD